MATPIDAAGRVDMATFDRLLEFLLAAGVDGVVVGGATGEYPHFQMRERAELVRRAAEQLPRNRRLVAGIGGPSLRRVIKLGRVAIDAGAESLLVPAPFFFRYEQDDLRAYFAHVSREVKAPCLLYDLPDFTNPILPPTVYSLLREEQHIVGIKDSSGRAGEHRDVRRRAAGRRMDAAGRRRSAAGARGEGRLEWRHLGCRRLLPRIDGPALPERRPRTDQRNRPAGGAGPRADRAASRSFRHPGASASGSPPAAWIRAPFHCPSLHAAGSRSRHSTPGSSPGCRRSDAARNPESDSRGQVLSAHLL